MPDILSLVGILLIVLAVFANQLGLDTNAQWGMGRFALFVAGLAFLALPVALRLLQKAPFSAPLKSAILKPWRKLSTYWPVFTRPIRRVTAFVLYNKTFSVTITLLLLTLSSLYAAWFTSHGYFPNFPSRFNTYVELGDAFLQGQVALREQPDPRLVAIQDPVNDVAARKDIPYRFDLSYYQGKYYAYWGPVPGVLNAAIQAVSGVKPAADLAPLIFYTACGLALILILFTVRRWAFPHAPRISIALFVLPALISLPNVFMLKRNDVYEAAILAGQCFLFIGLAGWLAYLVTRRPGWLLLAGTGYALAVGSRYNLALAVSVCLGFAAWEFWQEGCFSRTGLRRAVLLLAPLALMAVLLASYNYARFGNPLETGLQYQLANPEFQKQYYSANFIRSNLYFYLGLPASRRGDFPFIFTQTVRPEAFPAWAQLVPGKDFEKEMLGILPYTPLLWMLVIMAPLLVISLARSQAVRAEVTPGLRRPSTRRFVLMLSLAGIIEVLHMLLYYYGAMRFIADSYLLLLSVFIFIAWEVDQRLACAGYRSARALRVIFWLGTTVFALATALLAFLIGFEIPPQIFRQANPALYAQIAQPFNHLMAFLNSIIDNPSLFGTLLRDGLKVLHLR